MTDRPPIGLIRSVGHWAFVSVPDEEGLPCIVHYWHRRDLSPVLIARMLAHEIGHISDGGPKHWLGSEGEEDRADEFARVAAEVVGFLLTEGVLTVPRRSTMNRRSRAREKSLS